MAACLHTHTHPAHTQDTDRLRRLDRHKAVVPLLPTDVAKRPVVRDVLGDVGDLVDGMMMLEDLRGGSRQTGRSVSPGRTVPSFSVLRTGGFGPSAQMQ